MTDYTIYNRHYQYMEQVLRSLRTSNSGTGLNNVNQVGFLDVFKSIGQNTVSAPESMEAIFEEAAEAYDVPVNLLKAMAKVESGFDENAVSSAGAQGVMQLMPATARSLGVQDPFDARENIMGGAKYISQMLKTYDGDIDLALAAYNAGSGNVSKYGGVPPFPETINYINRIKGYMGENLTVDKQVVTGGYGRSAGIGTDAGAFAVLEETAVGSALLLVELMKNRLQMQINNNILSDSYDNTGIGV